MRKVIFSKFPDGRAKRFSLQTNIVKDNNGLYVEKTPMYEEAVFHIENIKKNYTLLKEAVKRSSQPVVVNECLESEKGVRFDFIDGKSLEEVVIDLSKVNKTEEIRFLLRSYYNFLLETMTDQKAGRFSPSEEAIQIFFSGDGTDAAEISEGSLTTDYVNTDLIFPNIIVNEKGWNIIDYEWGFCFPLPVRFVYYRAVSYLYSSHGTEIPLKWSSVLDIAKITPKDEEVFKKMEVSFQNYVKDDEVFLAEYRERIGKECIDINRLLGLLDKSRAKRSFLVFLDLGEGYLAKNSFFLECKRDGEGEFIEFDLVRDVKGLRIDPLEEPCIVRILDISTRNDTDFDLIHNGKMVSEGLYVFDNNDPQLIIDKEFAKGTHVRFAFLYCALTTVGAEMMLSEHNTKTEKIIDLDRKNRQLTDHIAYQRNELLALKSEIASGVAAYERAETELLRLRNTFSIRVGSKITNFFRKVKHKVGNLLRKIKHKIRKNS